MLGMLMDTREEERIDDKPVVSSFSTVIQIMLVREESFEIP